MPISPIARQAIDSGQISTQSVELRHKEADIVEQKMFKLQQVVRLKMINVSNDSTFFQTRPIEYNRI